jgi:hypothetical protein
MNKTSTLVLAIVFVLAMDLHGAGPNIIFVVTDDHGYNDLEATDLRGEVSMPNVDRLSTDGALMTQGYCTAPQCVPSRAGIITGRYQQRFGIDVNGEGPLPHSQKSIASRLKALGYKTGHVGKWHLKVNRETRDWLTENGYESIRDVPAAVVNSYGPQGFGYDWFSEGASQRVWSNFDVRGKSFPAQEVNYNSYEGGVHSGTYRIQLQTNLALAFIDRHVDDSEPFFLYLAYYGPHVPLDAPVSLTEQVLSLSELEARGYDNSKVMIKKGPNYAKDFTEAEVRQQGLALLKGIDNGVGAIYQMLEAKGELENTLFFFMSDNGAPLGRSWDGSVNDPSSDPMFDGVNLMPFLTGENRGIPHRYLYQRFMNTASVTEEKLKFMRHENGEELLFDLTMEKPAGYNPDKDYHESVNLVGAMPEKAALLGQELESWMQTLSTPHYKGGYHSSLYEFIERRWGFRDAR